MEVIRRAETGDDGHEHCDGHAAEEQVFAAGGRALGTIDGTRCGGHGASLRCYWSDRRASGLARSVTYRRPGGQSQFSAQLAVQAADREPLRDLQAWIGDHVAVDCSVGKLAKRVAMSPRNFARVFTADVGMTPGRFVERARVEAARRRLEESTDTVEQVAVTSNEPCGNRPDNL